MPLWGTGDALAAEPWLREWLKYAQHRDDCDSMDNRVYVGCTCGFSARRAEIEAALKAKG